MRSEPACDTGLNATVYRGRNERRATDRHSREDNPIDDHRAPNATHNAEHSAILVPFSCKV